MYTNIVINKSLIILLNFSFIYHIILSFYLFIDLLLNNIRNILLNIQKII